MRDLVIYLCRHGDTAWSGERRLAGRTDLPLTEAGEQSARRLGQRLSSVSFDRVLVSPLARARRTAELTKVHNIGEIEIDDRLIEMDFGRCDGSTVAEVRRDHPGWSYLRDGCPGGESPEDLGRRADAVLGDLASTCGNVALFAHSVILRVLTARYLGLPARSASMFMMAPGALSILRYDPVEESRAIASWNDH